MKGEKVRTTRGRVTGAWLVLDGATFTGRFFGSRISAAGEVVQTTGLVGFPETLTDPTCRGQNLVFTCRPTGNDGASATGGADLGRQPPRPFETVTMHAGTSARTVWDRE